MDRSKLYQGGLSIESGCDIIDQKEKEKDMRRIWFVLTALILVLVSVAFSAGCQTFHFLIGSGHSVGQNFDLVDFVNISAHSTFDVEVSQGTTYSVSVTVDDNLQKYLEVEKDGDTLKLGMKAGYLYNETHLKAKVTIPRLTGLTISGASKGNASGFKSSDDFILSVSGASRATLTDMAVKRLSLDISGASRATGSVDASANADLQASGASTIELTGKAIDADIESSGASTVNLSGFVVRDISVDISGASNATVNATGILSGEVSGASHLNYTGTLTLGSIKTSGASSINKK
jgi:hypothetical protein